MSCWCCLGEDTDPSSQQSLFREVWRAMRSPLILLFSRINSSSSLSHLCSKPCGFARLGFTTHQPPTRMEAPVIKPISPVCPSLTTALDIPKRHSLTWTPKKSCQCKSGYKEHLSQAAKITPGLFKINFCMAAFSSVNLGILGLHMGVSSGAELPGLQGRWNPPNLVVCG